MHRLNILVILLFSSVLLTGQEVIDLSKNTWRIWLDKEAAWEQDSLFLPPVDIKELPVNVPSCGWDKLPSQTAIETNVPATVEEFYWGQNGNSFGVAGNYVGVSWFSTQFNINESSVGKRIVLRFESVRLRAEIYVNQKLVGYDIINGTPFSVDVSNVAIAGANKLDVRITDPNGNFAWRDWETYKWGNYDINPSHGFGGITGNVELEISDKTFIEDLYVKNLPEATSIEVQVLLNNSKETHLKGQLSYTIFDKDNKKMAYQVDEVIDERVVITILTVADAKLWSPDEPNLYKIKVEWRGKDDSQYTKIEHFGFRWFEVRNVEGDRQFYLNDKRVVLRSAISWGHWPINGIYPTEELAEKQIKSAKDLGLNCLNFHRGMGQSLVLNKADEMGLMYYAEPGGYAPGQTEFALGFKQERLMRMIKTFRSHPSLVIYNMINEAVFPLKWAKESKPYDVDKQNIRDAHKMDENRVITYTSTCWFKPISKGCPVGSNDIKMCMLPNDTVLYNNIWWDEHHADGPGVYLDDFYKGPNAIYRHYNHPNEIIILGEEGAIGTPPRLELIKNEIEREGKKGWDGDTYLDMYNAFDNYLSNKDYRKSFPTVDMLTQSMGMVSHYYQGRIIENTRIGNLLDGYVVNGWENTKVENHSGVVDIYRNPKTDSNIMAYYNQPLYVAVKMRDKVIALGDTALGDFFIVNEQDLNGKFILEVIASDNSGTFFTRKAKVKVTGGHTYGELLAESFSIIPRKEGYVTVSARLLKGKNVQAQGKEKLYVVNLATQNIPKVAVHDTSGFIQQILDKVPGMDYEIVKNPQKIENGKVLMVGANMQPGMVHGSFRQSSPVMDWVSRGNTMVIIAGSEIWAQYLSDKEILDYRGTRKIQGNWFGGCYFVKDHPLFNGLPTSTAFNWEYQYLAAQKRYRIGLRIANGESVVGVNADHKREVYDALIVIPHGKGKIILSALDLSALASDESKSSAVAKRLIQNFAKF